jgi:hypothetical protein
MPATKIDLVREFKELYAPGREPATVEVPEFSFLMVDGHGDPNVAREYGHAVEALYSVSYTLKFALKRGPRGLDYRVMPLEGLWWVPDMSAFTIEDKSAWDWTMMIRQPEQVDEDLFEQALAEVTRKKKLPAANLVRLGRFSEGLVAQVMHIGPYANEGPTIQRLHSFIADEGYERAGKHHEIYLSDPRRAAAEKMKTVLRQPMASSGAADGRR